MRRLRAAADRSDQPLRARRVVKATIGHLRPLRRLHQLAPAVIQREPGATREFLLLLERHADHEASGRAALSEDGGLATAPGRLRTGRPTRSGPLALSPRPDPVGPGSCGLIRTGDLGAIAVAAVAAGAGGPAEVMNAHLATVAGMGLCARGLEGLHDAVVHDDPERFERHVLLIDGSLDRTQPGAVLSPGARDLAGAGGAHTLRGRARLPRVEGRPGLPLGPDGPGTPGLPWPDPGPAPDDPWGPGPLGPDDGPCPPPIPDRCELERQHCWTELMRRVRREGVRLPDLNDHVHADGIAQVEADDACGGDTAVILGTGFGESQPDNLDVMIKTADGCAPAAVIEWSDTRIEIELPEDVRSSCVGFLDRDRADRNADETARFNGHIESMNDLLTCLRMGRVPTMAPPSLDACPPCTDVNRLRAGPPVIRWFRADGDDETIAEPGDRVELTWLVSNADDLRLERVSTPGPDLGGATSLSDPPGTSHLLTAAAHTSPELWRYRLTATNDCGTVSADVVVVATASPRLAVGTIEVTQGIQTVPHDVRLVTNKRTVVRATLSHGLGGFGSNTVPDVTGRIRIRQVGGTWSPWFDPINGSSPTAPTPGASITVGANPDRSAADDTLNFLLPTGRCEGEVELQVEARVDDFGAPPGRQGLDERTRSTFGPYTFHERAALRIRYVRVAWADTGTTTNTPSHAECLDTIRRGLHRIPTANAVVDALPGVGVQTPPLPHDFDNDVVDLVNEFDDRHNCSLWEALTEWLGSECPEDDGAYWALITGGSSGGKAAGIPSNTYLTPVNDMNRAPHELAHSLDQLHIEVACPNGRQADGGESASSWPNQGQLTNVPFDIDANDTVTAGDGVFDIMTYCGTRWTMPRRWQQLYDHIGS